MNTELKKPAVILLSGGLDSATCAAIAARDGFELYAMTIRYGQRHDAEIEAAKRVAEQMQVRKHITYDLDLRTWGGSALTDDIAVPRHDRTEDIGDDIPVTYVPARNTIFLSLALAWAEVLGSHDIYIGVNALDYSGYPDCRPEFIEAFEQTANLATKAGLEKDKPLKIHTPLIELSKSKIIQLGTELGIDYALTHSCYDPVDGKPCGSCDSCLLRAKGFEEAGLPDPIFQ